MLFKKKSEAIYIDYVDIPLLLINNSGKIRTANKRFCNLTGMNHTDLVEKTFHEINFLKPLERAISTVLSSKKPYYNKHKLDEKHFEVSIYPFEFENTLYLSLYLHDVSSLLEIEKELLKRNKELMIINTLSSAFISSDNIDKVFTDLLEKILLITDFSVGWIVMKTDSAYELKSHVGISKKLRSLIKENKLHEMCNNIEAINDPLCVFESDEIKDISFLKEEGLSLLSVVPIKIGSNLKALLFLASRVETTLDFDLASLLSLIGNNLSLIIDKIELFEQTRRLSITDSLTGLFNTRFFYGALEKELARSKRYRRSFSLAIFDVDNFKAINDTYGHQVGDTILRDVALLLKKESRETDILARYGGEEFVIIFPDTANDEAMAFSERILHTVNNQIFLTNSEQAVRITISGGIASFPVDATNAKDLLYASDMAMYKAKKAGKKQVVCYNINYGKNI